MSLMPLFFGHTPLALESLVVGHLQREQGKRCYLPGVGCHDGSKVITIIDDAFCGANQTLIERFTDRCQ